MIKVSEEIMEETYSNLKDVLSNSTITISNELITTMLHSIGNTDSVLRDDLIYGTFHKWISNKQLERNQVNFILEVCNSNLLKGLGEKETDSVFKRSFSAIVCAAILNARYTVNDDMLRDLADNSLKVMVNEKDLRGYVENKGWAHSIAHTADLLDSIVHYSLFGRKILSSSINNMVEPLLKGNVFIDDEQERIAIPLTSILSLSETQTELNELFVWMTQKLELERNVAGLSFYRVRTNYMALLNAIYLNLLEKKVNTDISNNILAELFYIRNL